MLAHNWWLERDGRLRAEGERVCQAEHELALVRTQRDAALTAANRAREAQEAEQLIAEGLRRDHQTIKAEFKAFQDRASADPRCLSDGVLELLRGDGAARPAAAEPR
jgi:hypothetical protein